MDRITKALEMARQGHKLPERTLRSKESVAPLASTSPAQIEYTHTRTLTVDEKVLRKNRVVTALDDQGTIDAYRLLRTRVIGRMQQNGWTTLAVTSAGAGVGKTLTAVNLGISIAMKHNYTVVVVDADLRRPTVHKLFGFTPKIGLSDYLVSGTPIEDMLVHPAGIERFVILPGNGANEASSELLSSPKMIQLVKELKNRYPARIVIFDLPPVLVGDDVVAFAPNLDTALLIVEEGSTDSDQLEKALELLGGVEIIGTVLNKSKEKPMSYGYY